MNFRKIVEIEQSPIGRYDHRSHFMLWGSCFADHLRSYLERELYQVSPSPYGIMYNPLSMAEGMRRLLRDEAPRAEELVRQDGRWHSMMHHGAYSHSDRAEAIEGMRGDFERVRSALPETDLLILTFGTAWVYEMDGRVVNNCHKLPATRFTRRRLTPEEIVERWSSLIEELTERHPELRILLTVSPVPHYRDGAHESRLSKAVLLLAIDRLVQLFPHPVAYFPAYEIQQDELRDYRFYAEDMAHPSDLAVSYIMERFRESYLTEEDSEVLQIWRRVRGQLGHRPLTDDRDTLTRHYSGLLTSLQRIEWELPTDYLSREIDRIQETIRDL